MSGQYNDVRGDFQYKLTRHQGTPANADADRHLFVIFAPQPGDSASFILFFITLGRKRYQIYLLMRKISLKRMSNRLPQLRTCILGKVKTRANPYHNKNGCNRETQYSDARLVEAHRLRQAATATQKKIMISSCNTNFSSCDVFQVLTLVLIN